MSHRHREDAGHRNLVRGQPPSAACLGAARLCTMLIVLAIASFAALAEQTAVVKQSEDLPPGPMQAKATTSCLECHEARIILQQRLSKATWAKEVDKMIKWGAVVDTADHDALIDYLSSNFSPDQPPYQPPRTSVERNNPRKSK
jgi:hypothetical protein